MLGDEVAALVVEQYGRLPPRGKPLMRSNGVPEWTVLAGVVIRHRGGPLECVSVATGVKALPDEKVRAAHGRVLHDSHAEVLALRAFNRYVVAAGTAHIAAVYLYVCAPPCGDASLSLLNTAPGAEAWSDPAPASDQLLRGRAHFNLEGRVRTKPGRGDSPLTMSKSCSDKLCLRQTRGVLLAPVRQLYAPLFLTALVCPQICPDFERAFTRWDPRHRFAFELTTIAFADFHPDVGKPSPVSVAWWCGGQPEVIANGVLQGSGRPSSISRVELTRAVQNQAMLPASTYLALKSETAYPPAWTRTAPDDFALRP